MENYTRIIAGTSTNIRTPTLAEINQGNNQLTPFESAKMNGYYNEMSQQIGNVSTELTNLITATGLTPDATLSQVLEAINLLIASPPEIAVNNLTINNKLNAAPNAATISSGAISYTGAYMVIDTEGAAASDDLDTINGGSEGDIIRFRITDNARDITIRDDSISGGNIRSTNTLDQNRRLINIDDTITYQYRQGIWYETSRSIITDFTNFKSLNGYTYLPNGLIFQWGRLNGPQAFISVVFPIAFPTAAFGVQVTVDASGAPLSNYSSARNLTTIGADIGRDQNGSWWYAYGY